MSTGGRGDSRAPGDVYSSRGAPWGPMRVRGGLENDIYQQPSYSWDVPGQEGGGRGKNREHGELYVLEWSAVDGGWARPSGLRVLGLQPLPAPGFQQPKASSLGTGTRCQGLTCRGT